MELGMNLKKIERKAYLSYHQDGLLEIIVGMFMLVMGIGMATDTFTYMGWLGVLIIPLWTLGKRWITIRRMGYAKFGSERRIREKRAKVLSGILIALLVVSLVVLIIFRRYLPDEMRAWLRKFVLLPMGLIGMLGFGFLGYWQQIARYYIYALLILIAVFVGPVIGIPHAVYFSVTGSVITLSGLAILLRFVRKYPKSPDNADVKEG
jgi:hypothetical protein